MIGPIAAPVDADVLVLGGGAAGAVAALAAQELGAKVVVVRRSLGATAVSSGAADVAPDPLATAASPLGERRSLLQCAEALAARRPDHPYAILRSRLPELGAALAFAASRTGGALAFTAPDGANRWLLGPLGSPKQSAGGLATIAAGDLATASGVVGVVALGAHPIADARLLAAVASGAATRAGLRVELVPVFPRFTVDPELLPHQLARLLESPGELEALAAAVKAVLPPGVSRLLFPGALASGDARPALARLEALLGIPCAESLSRPPSVPGLRLQYLLDDALAAAGIRVILGEAQAEGGPAGLLRVREATPQIQDPSRFDEGRQTAEPHRPASFRTTAGGVVLATGKFLGGGVQRHGKLREAVFDLPVWPGGAAGPDRWPGDLTSNDLTGDQPFFRAGVLVDGRLRPLLVDGSVARPGLHACGGVLAGNDPAQDGAGLGLAIFTGYLAGREAAGALRR